MKELKESIKQQKKALESGTDESTSTMVDMQAVYKKAAELSDLAITDMADNANKMGYFQIEQPMVNRLNCWTTLRAS